MDALGLVEVQGLVKAVVAADVALKAANVQLTKVEKVKGGLVTIMLSGDVGAITAAIDAIKHDIGVENLVASHVIARPEKNIEQLFKKDIDVIETKVEKATEEISDTTAKVSSENKSIKKKKK